MEKEHVAQYRDSRSGVNYEISLFISDTHLGHPYNGALDVQGAMIEQMPVDVLYLVGDIIDYESIYALACQALHARGKTRQDMPQNFNGLLELVGSENFEKPLRFLDIVMNKISQGVRVEYITGNHDLNLDLLHGRTANGIRFHDHLITQIGGIKTYIGHGDDFDPACRNGYGRWYHRAANHFLDTALRTDHNIRPVFEKHSAGRRYPYYLTEVTKRAGKPFIGMIRKNAARAALEAGAHSVIIGHVHHIETRDIKLNSIFRCVRGQPANIVTYRNTGDGLTHGTALYYNAHNHENGGWSALGPADIRPSETFDVTKINPYAAHSPETLAFMEEGWKALLQTVNLQAETTWDHSGAQVRSPPSSVCAQAEPVPAAA